MIKKVLKTIVCFLLICLMTMMTIDKEYNKNKDTFYMRHRVNFVYKDIKNITGGSPFKVWRLMALAPSGLTSEELKSVIKSSVYPPVTRSRQVQIRIIGNPWGKPISGSGLPAAEMMMTLSFNRLPTKLIGSDGSPVFLRDTKKLSTFVSMQVRNGWHNHAFNQFISDVIPLNRSLPDVRHNWCKKQNYSQTLPKVSIIICFTNEAWSTLLRTVHSILNRTPSSLVSEIILYDDYSDMPHLKSKLKNYVNTLSNAIKIKLLRNTKREGLIRSRMKAIKYATGSILVFLDSHCECNTGWLEPLVDRIAKNPTTVVSPVVDFINHDSFEYIAQDSKSLRIGGFSWDLKFVWMLVPPKIISERPDIAAPIKTPTISGGLFAIDKTFFKKLGYYDEKLEIWGGENLELSFKTWMCGGTLEIVPCSHVGHVFRNRLPYDKGDPGNLNRNLLRIAEVWMDDYKKYFLERIGNPRVYLSDTSSREQLRVDLHCKSFEWYLKNVYPQLEIPDKYAASGQIFNIESKLCLDLPLSQGDFEPTIQLYPCHFGGGNQFWIYTTHGEIKRDEFCLQYTGKRLQMFLCIEGADHQKWLYNSMTRRIKHIKSKKCLQLTKNLNNYKLTVAPCAWPIISEQKWIMDKFVSERLDPKLYTH